MSTPDSNVMPVSICVHGVSRLFEIKWCDATRSLLSHRELRSHCKCAACEQARRNGQNVMPAEDIVITDVSAVGALGLQLHFNDGHSQGIFPFAFLRELGRANSTSKSEYTDLRAGL